MTFDAYTATSTYPDTPELDKIKEVSKESRKIGDFLEWLQYEKNWRLAYYDSYDELTPAAFSIEPLLAEFFDIDLDKAEKERMAVLEWVRGQNEVKYDSDV